MNIKNPFGSSNPISAGRLLNLFEAEKLNGNYVVFVSPGHFDELNSRNIGQIAFDGSLTPKTEPAQRGIFQKIIIESSGSTYEIYPRYSSSESKDLEAIKVSP